MPSNQVMKSYNALMVSGGILENVLRAVISAKDTAVRKSEVQTVDIYFRGHRHDLVWGKIMVIPAAVCDGDFKDLPKPILEGALLKSFAGEDLAEFQTFRLAESEFDVPTPEQMQVFKSKLFNKSGNGKFAPIVVFLPAWQAPSDYTIFQWVDDEETLKNALRELCFGVYYDPSLSVLYDELITVEDKMDLVHLKDGYGNSGLFQSDPAKSERPNLEKAAHAVRPKMLITAANVNDVMGELTTDGQPELEPEEEEVLGELAGRITSSKAASFMFTPGQVLREFYPELSNNLLMYPAQNNSGMPEATNGNNANGAPSGASLNPKPSMVQESVPLRREMQLRGPGAMDQFYRSVVNIPSGRLNMASLTKEASDVETEIRKLRQQISALPENSPDVKGLQERIETLKKDLKPSNGESEVQRRGLSIASTEKTAGATPEEAEALLEILQGVCGEIAATFISAFKVTTRPLALGTPGEGSVCLDSRSTGDQNVSTQFIQGLGSQVQALVRKMNDSDLQGILNDAWAQASVWCNGEKGGFTYEVLVRAEAFDDESLSLKYRFVSNQK
jgi:hypothetical protein